MATNATDRWTDNNRNDGLTVRQGESGGWLIIPGKGGLPILHCPCCDLPFNTAKAARFAADLIYGGE
jgi:hypothetical protein